MAARRLGGLRIIRFGNPGKNALAFTLGYLGVEDHGSMFSSCFFSLNHLLQTFQTDQMTRLELKKEMQVKIYTPKKTD